MTAPSSSDRPPSAVAVHVPLIVLQSAIALNWPTGREREGVLRALLDRDDALVHRVAGGDVRRAASSCRRGRRPAAGVGRLRRRGRCRGRGRCVRGRAWRRRLGRRRRRGLGRCRRRRVGRRGRGGRRRSRARGGRGRRRRAGRRGRRRRRAGRRSRAGRRTGRSATPTGSGRPRCRSPPRTCRSHRRPS